MTAAPERPFPAWARLTAYALAYLAVHRLGYALVDPVTRVSSLWPAGGFALALLLGNQGALRRPLLLALGAANLASNLYSAASVAAATGFLAANAAELLFSERVLLRASQGRSAVTFARVREVAALIFASTVVASASAVVGAGTVTLSMGAPFVAAYASWAVSDGLGVLVVTHLVVALGSASRPVASGRALGWDLLEAAALLAATLGIAWVYFEGRSVRLFPLQLHSYMVLPPLLWAAMRFGPAGASVATGALAALGIAVAIGGTAPTPLGGTTPIERLLSMQLYVGVLCVVAYVLAASIAERERDARALASSEEQLRQFIKHAPAAVAMLDTELRYMHASDRWLSDYHFEERDIIGRSHYEVFPEIPARWREIHRRALAGSIERSDDDSFVRQDGSVESLEWEVRPWRDAAGEIGGVSLFTQVTTERKRAERERREGEERFRQVVETIQEVFWMTDAPRTRVLYLSPGFEKIWGRPVASLYENHQLWIESVHPDDRARVAASATDERLARGEFVEEYRIVRPDGSERWISDRAFPVRDASGAVIRFVGVAEDVTDRRRVEEQLRQAQKMEAIGLLAGGVAHDFNNILAAIMMQSGLAAATPGLPPRAASLLKETISAARSGAQLTRQLLTFSRRQVMQRRVLDLNEVVASLATMLRRIVGEDVTIHLEASRGALPVEADRAMLDQLVMNLAVNGRDAMPRGGRLEIQTDAIELGAADAAAFPEAAPGRYARLRVADTGTGIAPEHLPRIFEPFFTTKELGKGTGLGLATVFGIVRQHRGAIHVASEPGKGTFFTVLLPAAGAPPGAAEHAPDGEPGAPGGTETLLVVEDDATVRVLARMILAGAGYRVVDVADGPAALRAWEDCEGRVDLLVTDIVMPGGMTGREVAARLRERRADLRVVFTSGYSANDAGRDVALEDGQVFLEKPYAPRLLLETVRRCLDHGKGAAKAPGAGA